MKPERPQPDEYQPFQAAYIALVPEADVLGVLAFQVVQARQLIPSITPEQEAFRYAPGKWSVRQVFGHLGDAERVFGYRMLCIARGQQEPMPPFDENLFVENGNFDQRTLTNLADELVLLRKANISMLEQLDDTAWTRSCVVNAKSITTRAIAWIMAGHFRHHLSILKDRYGI
jgi:hypothetical protein